MTTPRFDPHDIAEKAAEQQLNPLQLVIGQLVGYSAEAIATDEESGTIMAGAGVDDTVRWLQGQLELASAGTTVGRLEEGDRLLLMAGNLSAADAVQLRDGLQAAISGDGPPVTVLAGVGAAIVVAARAPEVTLDADEQDGETA